MSKVIYYCVLGFVLVFLTTFYWLVDLNIEADKIFLSISTFLFSIFTGFFISRQASRFNKVRETVTAFDGKLSAVYRVSSHIDIKLQTAIAGVVAKHYNKILESSRWDIHFTEPSTTLTDINNLLGEHVVEKKVTKLSNQAIGVIMKSLAACQDIRKQMVALYEEKIPAEQWVLIFFFAVILITTVSIIPSAGLLFVSLLKSAFVISIISVLLILRKLNDLDFTESIMGEHSARDVLGILNGTK